MNLSNIKRIEKLLVLVIVAFTLAYKAGEYQHNHVKPIKLKKHGNKARSIFKYGLSFIASVLLNVYYQTDMGIFKFLACT